MSTGTYLDSALVLVAHGSTLDPASAAVAWRLGDTFRRGGLFGEVHEAYVLLEPSVWGALRRISASRVFIVPLFAAEGWFTQEVIPVQLGLRLPGQHGFARVQERSGRRIHYCAAVGTHPSMTEVLLARARDVVARHPFPRAPRPAETALFIAGHGTGYSRGSREAVEEQVRRIQERNLYAEVQAVFLEESPGIEECWELAQARQLVLVPFFVSDGLHTREDIPVRLGVPAGRARERLSAGLPAWRNPGERRGRRLWYADPVGLEPTLHDLILRQVREIGGEADGSARFEEGVGEEGQQGEGGGVEKAMREHRVPD